MLSSFRVRLTVVFGLLASLVVVGLVVRQDQGMSRRVLRDRGQALHGIANATADMLAEGMSERLREVTLLAESETLQRRGPDATAWQVELRRLQQGRPYYSWLGVADAEGIVISAHQDLLVGQSVAQRPWFAGGAQAPYIGDVHQAKLLAKLLPASEDGPLRFLDYAAPLRRPDGRLWGVLGVHADWRWAQAVIAQLRRDSAQNSDQVEIYILDSAGNAILRPSGQSGTEDAVPGLRSDGAAVVLPWERGGRYLTVGVPLPAHQEALKPLRWTIVVRQPESLVLNEVAAVRHASLVLGGTAAALAMLLAWTFAGRLARPLRAIADTARRIEAGDLTARIPVISGSTELSQLSRSLATMTERLAERQAALTHMNRELERRVAERTAELADANALLMAQAMEDALTALPNRRAADLSLRQMLAQHRREGRDMALLLGDVDHFKRVNDTHGHAVGDQVLKAVAAALRGGLREGDFAARFGGEEFVVLLPGTDAAGAAVVGDKLRAAVQAVSVTPVGQCTISFGAAVADGGRGGAANLLRRADAALYEAKAGGRDRVHVAAAARTHELFDTMLHTHVGDL
jgi:diguanylate cyclase